jgi:hypothetical protein
VDHTSIITNTLKRLLVLVSVIAFLVEACTTSGGKEKTNLANAKPGDKVSLSETLQFDTVPNSVIPYGAKPALQFSNLLQNFQVFLTL